MFTCNMKPPITAITLNARLVRLNRFTANTTGKFVTRAWVQFHIARKKQENKYKQEDTTKEAHKQPSTVDLPKQRTK